MTPSKQTEKQTFSGTKPLLRVLQGERLARPPFWLMRQAGRYLPEYRELRAKARDFLDLCFRPDMAAEVTLQPLRRFGMDAAILFSDILVVPYALGQKVEFQEGRGPVLEPISSVDDLAVFDEEKFHQKLSPIYETVNRVRDVLDDKTALIGFAGSPWTVATYMVEGGTSRDFAKIKTWAYSDP
ncbi:MAG: uroporphyrinogen decarboxylase, partial [Rhodospirillales bacterium]|nr:uroporphyrinogen decarboxylase [Rhodospirillales bacterium]